MTPFIITFISVLLYTFIGFVIAGCMFGSLESLDKNKCDDLVFILTIIFWPIVLAWIIIKGVMLLGMSFGCFIKELFNDVLEED